MYLLDTNVVSELRKAKPHGGVLAWLAATPRSALFVSALTLGELQAGIEKTRGQDQKKATEIELWLDAMEISSQVIAMDGSVFREWARMMTGQSDYLMEDAMIAATAKVHRLTVATRNLKDFRNFGVPVVNPFEGA